MIPSSGGSLRMGRINMSTDEFKKYRLTCEVLEGKLKISDLATQLGKSYRQAQRIVSSVRISDIRGVYHGNCSKIPHNKTCIIKEQKVIEFLKGKYIDFNLTHFREKLEEVEGIFIGKNALYSIAKKQGLIKNPKRRGRRSHRPRARLPMEGMMIQFDGSQHCWFGDQITDLIGGIDDATGNVLDAEFFYGETSLNSMKVIRAIIDKNGLPESFYMDQAGIYGKIDMDTESQISRAFDQVGIRLILASSSQAKGRIERLWRTFQDRLVAELKLHQIKDIKEANEFLRDHFIPNYNLKFSVQPTDDKKAYRKNIFGNLDLIFCKKEQRKIMNGNLFSWNSVTWMIDEKTNYSGRQININTHINGDTSFDIMGRKTKCRIYLKKRLSDYGNRSKLKTG